jgi:Domain of unknown function (DUF4112)
MGKGSPAASATTTPPFPWEAAVKPCPSVCSTTPNVRNRGGEASGTGAEPRRLSARGRVWGCRRLKPEGLGPGPLAEGWGLASDFVTALPYYSGMTEPAASRRANVTVGTVGLAPLERLRAIARLLDSAIEIPGTRYRFGLDALIGLVPGIGDAAGAILSSFIIMQAARLGAPTATLVRMVGNVAVEMLVGLVPLLGDLFDVGWKANIRNVNLLEEHLRRPGVARAKSRRVLLLLGAGLVALLVIAVALGVLVANSIMELLK